MNRPRYNEIRNMIKYLNRIQPYLEYLLDTANINQRADDHKPKTHHTKYGVLNALHSHDKQRRENDIPGNNLKITTQISEISLNSNRI